MTNGVLQATDVVKSYNKKEVLHSVSLTIEPGKIYGLIGRNGAGKTTLLSILTAQNTHDSGLVTYNGERVWENQKALDEICFSRELSPMLLFGQNTLKVKEYLRAAALYYPHWDKEYAARLIEMFGLDTKKKIYKLSKGMMSMVTIVLALASPRAHHHSRRAGGRPGCGGAGTVLRCASGRLRRNGTHLHHLHPYHRGSRGRV